MGTKQVINDIQMLRRTANQWSEPILKEAVRLLRKVDELERANFELMKENDRLRKR